MSPPDSAIGPGLCAPTDGAPAVVFRARARGLRHPLTRFAGLLAGEVTNGRPFVCLVTGDAELRHLNRDFRGRDVPTDVLSFPSSTPAELGDIAISLDRARVQAREYRHSTAEEASILMLHGVLHLMGYDHARDGGRMLRVEARWRRKLGLPAGLVERSRS